MKFSIFVFLLLSLNSFGQSSTKILKTDTLKGLFLSQKDKLGQGGFQLDTLNARFEQLERLKFINRIALERQQLSSIEEESFAIKHRARSFDFQYIASIIIFIMVLLIVIVGLFYSGWQFRIAVKQTEYKQQLLGHISRQPAEQKTAAEGLQIEDSWDALKSELEITKTGVKVNSSILGVIILVLSIAFFYLYLIYVYPIKYVNSPVIKQEVLIDTATTNR